jgi:RNA polymerase sigma factor (sigma-70 family)
MDLHALAGRGLGLTAVVTIAADAASIDEMPQPLDATDEALLLDLEHPREAFGVFYERYETAVLRFFSRRVGSADVCADLTAETFAQALASRARYRPEQGAPSAWLFGIAANVLKRSLRKKRVEDRARRRLGVEPLPLDDAAIARIEEATAHEATTLLTHLPPDQREALEARILAERDYSEIASSLRCSESVIRQRVSRGLAQIRRQMEIEQ